MGQVQAFLKGTGLWALAMLCGGCDSTGRVQEPSGSEPEIGTTDLSGSSEFDRELIAAKNGIADPFERLRAMEAVLDKYGVAHPPATEFDEAADPAGPIGPAAKTASHSWAPVRRDFQATNDIHTYRGSVTVGNGQFARFAALGSAANVDPFLVAYYVDENPAVSTAYIVKVIGYNDDVTSDNRNAVVTWTNNTGNSKTIQFVAFAYSSAARGKGLISTTVNGSSVNLADRQIGGLKQFGATPLPPFPGGCSQPLSTTIKVTRTSGSERGAALVIDTQAMRGGHLELLANPDASRTLPWIVHNPGPSFALLYKPYTGILPSNWAATEVPTQYRFTQTDRYGCVD
jgi:hypothetical protein